MAASFGTRLRAHRERRGVTLTAIAETTKINIALLEGLERDDVSRWPGGLFRRAYLRDYAKAIGIDADATLREFLDVHPDRDRAVDPSEAVARVKASAGFLRSGLAAFRRDAPPPSDDLGGNLLSLARVCTALGCARDQQTVQQVLADATRLLGARGLIVWVWDAGLRPAIAHGYPDATLQGLAALARDGDSAITAAFRTAEVRVVPADEQERGAVVTPLLTPDGCVGVLAIEFRDGREQRETTRAFAAILGAQISTLLPSTMIAKAVSA